MKGFFGKILRVDLSRRDFREEEIPEEIYRCHLGGKGLGTHLLLELNPRGVDPLSPGNRLIFALGPVTDTPVWGSCRYGVYTKSPLTGFYSESYAGGRAPEAMSRTGYDAIVLEGRSEAPVVLEVTEGKARFHDARDLWGLDAYEAEERALERVEAEGRKAALVIGPAGERLVAFSVIANDRGRQAGRTGVGAVMGSKGVKAVVFHGSRRREVADPDALEAFVKEIKERGKTDRGAEAYRRYGTPQLVAVMNQVKGFPSKYWSQGHVEGWEGISAQGLLERCRVRAKACPRCFMACAKVSEVIDGRHQGLKIEGPEYETIYAFGGLCLVKDIRDIVYLNDICDRLGLDTITAGNLVAFAIEASRRGRVSERIDYGDVDAIAGLLHRIAFREGIGDLLAKGIRQAAKEWGLEELAVHVKGLEPAGYDPRVLKGMALAYATSARGACHLRTTFYKPELTGLIDPDQIEGKAALLIEYEDRLAIFDSLIVCRFYRDMYQWEELLRIVEAVTGMKLRLEDLRKTASHIVNSTRLFNLREGLKREDDTLPVRFHREPLPESGKVVTEEEFLKMLSEYYELRSWSL